MVTMILVEDESFERRALMEHIDWNLIGVEVVGEAVNGQQGLTLAMERRPDIVLTDVSMPAMNGIEMARKIRAILPETRILFLSAYDDFDYAKQAIDLNIQAYVMKPVNEGELLRAVKRVADEIMERTLEKCMVSHIKTSYSESRALARQALINRVLQNLPVKAGDLRKQDLEWLRLPAEQKSLLLTVFPPEATQRVEEALPSLNAVNGRAGCRAVSVCLRVGRLLTLCAWERADQVARVEENLRQLFSGLDIRPIRSVRKDADGDTNTFSRLNAALLHVPDESSEGRSHKNRTQIAEEIRRVILERYHQPLTLESIAKEMHFTPNYVGTVFKSVNRVSVNAYLMQVRMDQACARLLNTEDTVNDIAADCGFGSITYFHTCFKRKFGITPLEYRQSHAEEEK